MTQVGVGVGILVLRDGQVLLGRRRGSHGAGTWSAPGGRLVALADLPGVTYVFDEVKQQYLTVFVLARRTLGEPATLEPDKCDGWQWFDWQALPQPLFAPLHSLRATGFDPSATCANSVSSK